MELLNKIEGVFYIGIEYVVMLIELIGVVVLCCAVLKAIVGFFKKKPLLRLELAEGIALALEFKMGGELLRTVVVRDMSELFILGAVIILRAALTFLIQWEISIEKKNAKLLKGDETSLTEEKTSK